MTKNQLLTRRAPLWLALLLWALSLVPHNGQAQTISQVAGDGTSTGTGSSIGFGLGSVFDAAGNLYLAGGTANVIRKVTPGGAYSTIAGTGTAGNTGDGGAATSATVANPTDLAIYNGELYFTQVSLNNYYVRKINLTSGVISRVAGDGTNSGTGSSVGFPQGIALDAAGNLYIAGGTAQVIRKMDTGGTYSTIAGTGTLGNTGDGGAATAATVANPTDLAVYNGELYFTQVSLNNYYVRKINLTSGFISQVAGDGTNTGTGSSIGFGQSVLVDGGNLYVAGGTAHVVRKKDTSGTYSTIAGTAGTAGNTGDGGPATSATVATPTDLVSLNADLYFTQVNAGNYYVRKILNALLSAPTVTTTTPATITSTSAVLGGNVTANGGATVTDRGVVYSVNSTNGNPTIGGTGVTNAVNGTGTGSFSATIAGLAPSTTYAVAAYATNSQGTSYGSVLAFTTPALPRVTSLAPPSGPVGTMVVITGTGFAPGATVTFGGTTATVVTVNSATQITAQVPAGATTGNVVVTTSAGSSNAAAANLFTVTSAPTVATATPASVGSTSAVLGGNVTADGGATVTDRGVVYSTTNTNPTVNGTGTTTVPNGSGTGNFSATISGLAPGTLYYVVAYATNNAGTSYGGVLSFTTLAATATVTGISKFAPTAAQSATGTATATVRFTVTFSANVTGLTVNNFSTTNGSSLTGSSISSVVGSGASYTVTANTGTGSGTLQLNVANATGISPSVTNTPFAGTSAVYTITKNFAAAPQLTIVGTGGTGTDVTAFVDVAQVLSGGTAFANGLQNGSFETHAALANGDFGYNPSGATWTFNAQSGIAESGSAFTPVTPIPNGIAVAFVQSNGGGNGQIQQNLAVPTGSNYQVSFQAAQRLCCTTLDQALNVFLNGVFLGNILPGAGAGYLTFTSPTFSVTAATVVPTVSTTSTSPTSTAPIPFSVSFTQNVGTTFTASDVTVSNGSTLNTASFSGSGAGPYTFTVMPPAAGGTVTVSVAAGVANDANNTQNTASNSLSVQYQAPTITVAPATLPGGTQGTAYSQTITASGGTAPYSFSFTGTLPTGLTLASNGVLSGTPLAAGTFNFTVTATDASTGGGPYTGSQAYTVVISLPLPTVWTGTFSTDWYTAGNWTAGVPTANTSATIPGLPTNQPFIPAGTASALDLTLNSGATLSQSNGTLNVNGNLTNNGTFQPTGGTVVLGTTAQSNGPTILGSSRVRFWNLTVNSNGVLLSTSAGASVRRLLSLSGAVVTQGNPFVLESDAATTALVYNVNSAGFVFGAATVQRYIDASGNTGTSGYRHYSAPVGGATVGSLSTSAYGGSFTAQVNTAYNTADPNQLTLATYPNVFSYDESKIATSPAGSFSDFDKGYQSPASLSDALTVGRGYAVQIGNSEKVQLTGPLNNNAQTITGLTYAAAGTSGAASAGWALVGNPYPAPLDWGTVTTSQLTSVDAAAYVFQSTSAYAGRYSSFTNGVGAGTGRIASGQGFFVHASTPGTTGSISLSNANRVTAYNNPAFQRTAETRPLLRLSLGLGTAPATVATAQDETFVYFETGATDGFDGKFDAYKLANPSGYYLGSVTPGASPLGLSIDARSPLAVATTTEIPLWVSLPAGSYTLTATELLNFAGLSGGTQVQLRDALLGTLTDLATTPSHSFTVAANAPYAGRFSLVFRTSAALATTPGQAAALVSLYPNPVGHAQGSVVLAVTGLPVGAAQLEATLLNALGQVVGHTSLSAPASGAARASLPTQNLATGVYLVRLTGLGLPGGLTVRLTVD